MIYFDNSATSRYKPECVIGAVTTSLRRLSANPGRSGHSHAMKAARIVALARERATAFFNNPEPDNCVFTGNCTQALNLAIFGTAKKGHIITSVLEHNSVLRPLNALSNNLRNPMTVLEPGADYTISADTVARAIRQDTYLIAVTHVSNVLGTVNPVAEIAGLAREKNILFLTDCAQSAGHVDIDMTAAPIDMAAAAPHKGLLAPQGVGLLLFSKNVPLKPVVFGGTGVDSINLNQSAFAPESFEAGTLPTPAIAGFSVALNYINLNKNMRHRILTKLTEYLFESLSKLPFVKIYSPNPSPCGVVAFNVKGQASSEVATILSSQYDICVRGGLHCAPLAHRFLGTLDTGLVRVSLSAENTTDEIDALTDALKEISMF